ncbi:MAG: hypothetical protein V3T42_13420 [Nitrospirales bacterium]
MVDRPIIISSYGSVEEGKIFSIWRILSKSLKCRQGTGAVQKGLSSKAAGLLARGTYTEYVSTTPGREGRWRTFSIVPIGKKGNEGDETDFWVSLPWAGLPVGGNG